VTRLASLQRRMAEAALDALVCRLPENVVCATGYAPLCGLSFLCLPREGEGLLVAPAVEAELLPPGVPAATYPWGRVGDPPPLVSVRRLLEPLTRGWHRIGWEADFEAVAPAHVAAEVRVPAASTAALLREACPGAELVDATGLWHAERARKLPEDLERLRLACAAAEFGVRAFEQALRPGVSEAELVAEVEAAVVREGTGLGGARSVRAYAQVLAGTRTAEAWGPAYLATRRPVAPGELVLLELATYCDGYWSDLTRVGVAGRPSERQREVYGAVAAALEAARRAAVPGARAAEVDHAAREALARAGLEAAFPHHTGHGLGFRYHEPLPLLHPASGDTLQAGMVCTLEPGVYLEGWGGLRLEEDVAVGPAEGAEPLSVPARPWP
jgi:Xaa-Pro dipeptidase